MANILICDDERDIVTALKIYLSSEGYGLYEAFTGREALEIVRKHTVCAPSCAGIPPWAAWSRSPTS